MVAKEDSPKIHAVSPIAKGFAGVCKSHALVFWTPSRALIAVENSSE